MSLDLSDISWIPWSRATNEEKLEALLNRLDQIRKEYGENSHALQANAIRMWIRRRAADGFEVHT